MSMPEFEQHVSTKPRRQNRGWLAAVLLSLFGSLLACWGLFFGESPTVQASAPPPPRPRYETRAIEDLREGDLVLARDEHGHELGLKRIVETYERTSDHLRILTFESEDGTRQTLETTDEHPFWTVGQSEFVEAKDLTVGDQVTGPHGELQHLVATVYEPHPEGIPVYNFQVEDYHTYYVRENATRGATLLVHNADYVPEGRKVYRELSPYDRARYDAGKALQEKSTKGTIEEHVLGGPTGHISASDTPAETTRFHSGNGLAEIDVDKVRKAGSEFIDHDEVLRNLTNPDAIHDAITAEEVLFNGPIPASAMDIIDNF